MQQATLATLAPAVEAPTEVEAVTAMAATAAIGLTFPSVGEAVPAIWCVPAAVPLLAVMAVVVGRSDPSTADPSKVEPSLIRLPECFARSEPWPLMPKHLIERSRLLLPLQLLSRTWRPYYIDKMYELLEDQKTLAHWRLVRLSDLPRPHRLSPHSHAPTLAPQACLELLLMYKWSFVF